MVRFRNFSHAVVLAVICGSFVMQSETWAKPKSKPLLSPVPQCAHLLNAALDISQLSAKVISALESGANEVFLSELRPDVDLFERLLSKLEVRTSEQSEDRLHRGDWKSETEPVFKMFRSNLEKLRSDPRGVPYARWLRLVEIFSAAAHSYSYYWVPESWAKHLESMLYTLESTTLQSIARHKGWLQLPTALDLDIPTLNEWMSYGIVPLGLTENTIFVDGREMDTFQFLKHDREHASRMPRIGSKPWAEKYFKKFRKSQEDQKLARKLRQVIEAVWFDVYHEHFAPYKSAFKQASYSPHYLRWALEQPRNLHFLRQEIRPGKLWRAVDGSAPDITTISKARNWLLAFANEQL